MTKVKSSLELQKEKTSQWVDQIFPTLDQEALHTRGDFFSEAGPVDDAVQYIHFTLGQEYYALEVLVVREIIRFSRLSFLPSAPRPIAGLINLRGNVFPVIHTHQIFNQKTSNSEAPLIMILEIKKSVLGFIVDSVSQMIPLRKEEIHPPILTLEGEATKYLIGECMVDGHLVGILDIHTLVKNEVFAKVHPRKIA
jgi:purine-binding chemotaxis protein CheW